MKNPTQSPTEKSLEKQFRKQNTELIPLLSPEQLLEDMPDAAHRGALPNPDEISYYVLEQDRKLYLDTEVGYDTLTIQRMILRWNMEDRGKSVEERKPIHLYVMCYGGELDYMWSLLDTIKLSTTPIYTVNMGVAASAASLIFIAGHKRFMLPSSVLIIHEGSAQMSGDAVKIFDNVDNYNELVKKMKQFILKHSTISPSLMNKKRNNDWHINAEFCLKNHACDQIVASLDEII